MTKEVFLSELERRLAQLPEDERRERLSYYDELISDMCEDGMSEAEATAKLGDVKAIAEEILREQPLPRLVKSRVRPKNGWTTAAIVLVILGSPLWIPLLFALIMTVFAVVTAFAAVIFALLVTVAALAFAGIAAIIKGFGLIALSGGTAVFAIGAGFLLLGFTCLAFLAAKFAAIGLYRGGRWLIGEAKALLIKKEN